MPHGFLDERAQHQHHRQWLRSVPQTVARQRSLAMCRSAGNRMSPSGQSRRPSRRLSNGCGNSRRRQLRSRSSRSTPFGAGPHCYVAALQRLSRKARLSMLKVGSQFRRMRHNRAAHSDARRASREINRHRARAGGCGRSVARGNAVSANVLRPHDAGNSLVGNADGCWRPTAASPSPGSPPSYQPNSGYSPRGPGWQPVAISGHSSRTPPPAFCEDQRP